MKRLAFTTLIYMLFLSIALGQAQDIKTSKFILGGSFSIHNRNNSVEAIPADPNATFSNVSEYESSRFSFTFNPYVAKQINSNSMIGLRLQYAREVSTTDRELSFYKNSSNGFGIGFFYRQYIYELQSFSFFLQPSANILHSIGKTERDAPAVEDFKSNDYSAGLSLNVSYSIDKWNLFASLIAANYSHNKHRSASQESATTNTNLSLSTALSNFRFGIEKRF